tara:strand:+ start:5478 stop:8063 length:2586 start_codon:yes stop_codon:yes gene_type:complete
MKVMLSFLFFISRSCVLLLFFFHLNTRAQYLEVNSLDYNSTNIELLITIELENNYRFETNVVISGNNLIFIDIAAIFNSLKIKCIPNLNGLEGFIKDEANLYRVNYDTKKITVGNRSINIEDGIIEEFGVKYIAASIISQAFGLTFTFNPRSLTAKMVSNFELPILKQFRVEKNRNKISKRKSEIIADTIIPRNYHLFKFGSIDWGLSSTQITGNPSSTNLNIGVGTELLFGEAIVSLNYNPLNKFDNEQLRYGWRWVNNDNKFIKQAQIGQISSQSATNLGGQLIGATINNSSNTIKKASGYYTINKTTEPNWTVELYINDALVDYTVADAMGLYQFKVPIIYGYITTKLKFYGPLGEERSEERTINTPYAFTTAKNLLYNFTTGIVQNAINSRFAKVDFNYGVSKNLTINGGVEYLSSNLNQPFTPYGNIAFQPYSKMVLNLKYIPNVIFSSLVNLYITKRAFLEINYSKPLQSETNVLTDLRINFSTPFKTNLFSGFTKIKYNRFVYESFAYNQVNFTLSSYFKKIKINSSSFMNWTSDYPVQMNSNLVLSYKLKNGYSINTFANYNLSSNYLLTIGTNIQARILKMNLTASYFRNIQSNNNNFSISAAYDLPYSRVGISSTFSNNQLSFSETAVGSLSYGGKDNYVHARNNSAMGKGGILFYPFLDLNRNGILDNEEKRVLLNSVSVSGARADISKKDSIVRVVDLNAFVNYRIEFSDTDLDYVSWRFKHNTYQVLVDPNQYKRIFVPIYAVGEVNGMVYLSSGKTSRGQGRIKLLIYDHKGIKVAETLSEFDGYFNYLGLKPGSYTIQMDEAQLKTLNYQALPSVHPVTINVSEFGDIIDHLDFTLSPKIAMTPKE